MCGVEKCLVATNPEGKGLRERPSRRGEYNLILKKEGMHWINVADDMDRLWALVKTALDLCMPYSVRGFLPSCRSSGMSRLILLHEGS
jgi:hypothetical protein